MVLRPRSGIVVAAVLGLAACGPPTRYSLPTPFPVIMGATPVSSEGIAFGPEVADGVRGQELQRTETRGAVLAGGIGNRFGAAISGLRTPENGVNAGSFRLKWRVARPFGKRSALGLHAGFNSSRRSAGSVQNETMSSGEVAVPLEVLATKPDTKAWLSAFVAPRITTETYTDKLDANSTFSGTFAGLVSGLHLRAWFLDLFAETTVTRVPQNTYKGVLYPARTVGAAAVALTVRIGRAYDWMGK